MASPMGRVPVRKILAEERRVWAAATVLVTCLLLGVGGAPASAQDTSAAATEQQRTAYPGGTWEPGPAEYGSTIVENVPVTMDDGVILDAMVGYPTDSVTGERAEGEFPVIVEHTPYVTLASPIVPNTFLVEHGYIYVVVRARGAGQSGGELSFFNERDGMDGKAIVDWAANELDGSDGRLALLGCSWPGGMAITTAAYLEPDGPVKAVVSACNGLSGLQRQTLLVGGLQTTRMATFATGLLPYVGNTPSATEVMRGISNEIASGGDAAYDREFWSTRRSLNHAERVVENGLPVLLWTGWGDYVDIGAIRTYSALQNVQAGRDMHARPTDDLELSPRYQLVIGGWGHAQGLDAGVYLQWIETWLNDVDTGVEETETPLHVFETGSERWINLKSYPVVEEYTLWNLTPDGDLTTDAPDAGEATLVWDYPSQSNALLGFTTPVFEEGATLAGPISATVHASSSNTNMVLIAKLFDVAPDGSQTEISRGAILGSQRTLDHEKTWTDANGVPIWPWPTLTEDDYLEPGEIHELQIALAPRQAGIAPGHRLRLELTTRSPEEICPREGLPPRASSDTCALTDAQQETVPGGTYTLHFGPERRSSLNLPQLPWEHFPSVETTTTPSAWAESQREILPPEESLGLPAELSN